MNISDKTAIVYRALNVDERRTLPSVNRELVARFIAKAFPTVVGDDAMAVAYALQFRCGKKDD